MISQPRPSSGFFFKVVPRCGRSGRRSERFGSSPPVRPPTADRADRASRAAPKARRRRPGRPPRPPQSAVNAAAAGRIPTSRGAFAGVRSRQKPARHFDTCGLELVVRRSGHRRDRVRFLRAGRGRRQGRCSRRERARPQRPDHGAQRRQRSSAPKSTSNVIMRGRPIPETGVTTRPKAVPQRQKHTPAAAASTGFGVPPATPSWLAPTITEFVDLQSRPTVASRSRKWPRQGGRGQGGRAENSGRRHDAPAARSSARRPPIGALSKLQGCRRKARQVPCTIDRPSPEPGLVSSSRLPAPRHLIALRGTEARTVIIDDEPHHGQAAPPDARRRPRR